MSVNKSRGGEHNKILWCYVRDMNTTSLLSPSEAEAARGRYLVPYRSGVRRCLEPLLGVGVGGDGEGFVT